MTDLYLRRAVKKGDDNHEYWVLEIANPMTPWDWEVVRDNDGSIKEFSTGEEALEYK